MDAATLAVSLTSGTTYLKDPVEELLGHPAAQVISAECVTETVQGGCRLVTHYTTGAKSRDKPYRWMAFRLVPWDKVLQADPQHRARGASHPEAVWHAVVHELRKTTADGVPIVCASYFLSNFEAFFSVVEDKFELLDEDDPRIIQAALQDEDFCTVLKLYFNTGSPTEARFIHTLATVGTIGKQCLLHYCCEKGFTQCVALLLESYTPRTAPVGQPWLQLADPLWQDRAWKNSAFSIAAYRGHAEMLSLLWTWAEQHCLTHAVTQLKDKKGMDLCTIIENRLQKLGRDHADYIAAFNVIAEGFGKQRMTNGPSSTLQPAPEVALAVVDVGRDRQTRELPSKDLSLLDLVGFFEATRLPLEGAGLLLLGISVTPCMDEVTEGRAAERLLQLLAPCNRVSFMKCFAPCRTTICLVEAAVAGLRSGRARWTSLGIVPSWTLIPEHDGAEELKDFADAVEAFLAVVHEKCGELDLISFDMPKGMPRYFPRNRQHLWLVLGHAFTLKRVAFVLTQEGSEQDDFRRKIHQDETAHNPMLGVVAPLERQCLKKSQLISSTSVAAAMDEGWKPYVTAMVASLKINVTSMFEWAPRLGLAPGSTDERMLCKWVDEALLHFLKMRPSSRHEGLELVDLVKPAVVDAEGQAAFPESAAYCRHRGL